MFQKPGVNTNAGGSQMLDEEKFCINYPLDKPVGATNCHNVRSRIGIVPHDEPEEYALSGIHA